MPSLTQFAHVSIKFSRCHALTQICSFLTQFLNFSFFDTLRNFYQNSVSYGLKKLPLHDKVLEHERFVNFLRRTSSHFTSAFFFV